MNDTDVLIGVLIGVGVATAAFLLKDRVWPFLNNRQWV